MKLLFIISFYSILMFAQIGDNLNNRFMLAQNFEQAGDFEKAESIYEELYKIQPENYQFFDALNRMYTATKDYEKSIIIISERLKSSPEDINLFGLLGTTYYQMGDEESAYKTWDEAAKKFPSNSTTYRILANYAIERRAFEKAAEFLEKGKETADDPVSFSYELANIYTLTMQYHEAAAEYCEILSREPNQVNIIESRIISYIGKPDALEKTIPVFESWSNEGPAFQHLLARLYTEKKDYDSAFELYLDIDVKQNKNGTELFSFAQILFRQNELDAAEKVYSEIIKRYPGSPLAANARLGYARTLEEKFRLEAEGAVPEWKPFYVFKGLTSKSAENIITVYNELAASYPRSEIATECLFRVGEIKLDLLSLPEEAGEYFLKIIEQSPASSFALASYLELGRIHLKKGDVEKAEFNFLKVSLNARAKEEQRNLAKYNLARIHFYKGNFTASRKVLDEILDNLKDNSANDALQFSMILNPKMSDSSNLVLFSQAEFAAEQNKFGEAAEKYKVLAGSSASFLLKDFARIRESEMEIAMDNYDKSVILLMGIAEEKSTNIYADKALYLTGKIYQFGINNVSKAVEIYEKLLAKFPDSLYLDEAREEIKKLKKKLT